MTTDWRALCAELADELQGYIDYAPVGPCDEEQALVDRARVALAQPEPVGPTDEELLELLTEHEVGTPDGNNRVLYFILPASGRTTREAVLSFARAVLARWGRPAPQPEPVGPTDEELKAAYWEAFKDAAPCGAEESWLSGLRAVAHWGRPALAPIPVSERLPYDEDCDAAGECWWFHAGAERWDLLPRPPLKWMEWSHWLPFHALPLPEGGAA